MTLNKQRNPQIRLINLKDHRIISDKCLVAESFFTRFFGWMGKAHAVSGEGILFPKCTSVHMWFMSIPIDVVFLRNERDRKVVTSVHSVRPWKLLPLNDFRAHEALELPAGSVASLGISVGDELCIG